MCCCSSGTAFADTASLPLPSTTSADELHLFVRMMQSGWLSSHGRRNQARGSALLQLAPVINSSALVASGDRQVAFLALKVGAAIGHGVPAYLPPLISPVASPSVEYTLNLVGCGGFRPTCRYTAWPRPIQRIRDNLCFSLAPIRSR